MSELWAPKCPRCGDSKLMLAPTSKITHGLILFVEVYCANCQWQEKLADHCKAIYVRM